MKYKPIEDREAFVRAVFALPAEMSLREAAKRLNVHHATVASVRCGEKFGDVLPGIPRFNRDGGITCLDCIQFTKREIFATETESYRSGVCDLKIPEAENIHFAKGCPAFFRKP